MPTIDQNLQHRLFQIWRNAAKSILVAQILAPISVFAAHPLATEDSGVQGENHWQFELNTDRAVERDSKFKSLSVNATLTYGLADSLDLAINAPWLRNQVSDEPREFQKGAGDASVSMKWRIYETGNLNFAVKPFLFLPTGDSAKGLGYDRTRPGMIGVTTWGDDKLSLSANLGYTYNDNKSGDRKGIWNSSASVVVSLLEQLHGAAEIGTYTNSDANSRKSPSFANIGLIYSPTDKLDLDIGYKHGLNDAESLYSVGAGVTLRW